MVTHDVGVAADAEDLFGSNTDLGEIIMTAFADGWFAGLAAGAERARCTA
jgi:hypothetical protein